MKFEVTVDRGVDLEGKHYVVREQIEADPAAVGELVEKGFLTPAAEPSKEPKRPRRGIADALAEE